MDSAASYPSSLCRALQCNDVLARREYDLPDGDHSLLADRISDHSKRLLADLLTVRCNVVRITDVQLVNLRLRNIARSSLRYMTGLLKGLIRGEGGQELAPRAGAHEPSNGLTSWMSEESDPSLYHAHVVRSREPTSMPPQGLVLESSQRERRASACRH